MDEAQKLQQREAAHRWIKEKWTLPENCPLCGTIDWTILDLSELRQYAPGYVSPVVYPVIPVMCDNCGYTRLLNAVKAGIIASVTRGTLG